MRKGQIVKVVWRDIVTELSCDDLSDTIEAVHVGMIDKQNSKTLWLKSGWYVDEKNWPSKDGIAIPKGCIEKVEVYE